MVDYFKAGARIARTGGDNAESVARKWCEEHGLTSEQEGDVLAGYLAEIASNLEHRAGLPLGGKR